VLHPSVPTAVVNVELVGAAEDGVPHVVTCTAAENVRLVLGEGSEQIVESAPELTVRGATADLGAVSVVGARGTHPGHNWLLGLGDGSERAWRTAGAALVRAANQRLQTLSAESGTDLQLWLPALVEPGQVAALVSGLIVGSHHLRVSAAQPELRVSSVMLITTATYELRDAVRAGRALGRATALARDLAGMPSDVKSPQWIRRRARGRRRLGSRAAVVGARLVPCRCRNALSARR